MVAWVPKNPACLSHSAITSLVLLVSYQLNPLYHGDLLQLDDQSKACLGHPLHRVACLVTAALLGVDEDVHRECRCPSWTSPRLIEEPILDDQSTTRSQMVIDLFHQRLIRIKCLIMQNVGHQHDIVGASESILVEISSPQRDPGFQSGFFDGFFREAQCRGKIKHCGGQFRIHMAKGHRVSAGAASQIQHAYRTAEL